MTRKEKGKLLENFVAEHLKSTDKYIRTSRASGASYDISDIVNKHFYMECKNWNKENIILKRKDWLKLLNDIPLNSIKIPLYIFQNKHNEKFAVLLFNDLLNIIKEDKDGKKAKE